VAAFWNWATIGNNNYGRETAAFFLKPTVGNNNYGREAVAFLMDKWKQLRPRSGRLLFELSNWVALPPLFCDQKIFYQKNTKVTNSTQNYYGCKAVSTSVASLFHLKRHKRFSSFFLT
jgi:hypothetical protein